MTKEDLINAGIINNGKISDVELGLLLLKYNRMSLKDGVSEFDKMSQKIKDDFDFGDRKEGFKTRENKFLLTCLAISQKPFQITYMNSNSNEEALLKFHKLAVEAQDKTILSKENIRAARSLAEVADSLRLSSQKYKENKDQYEYLLSCLTDEEVFDVFYKRLEGRLGKSEAKEMIASRYPESQKAFLTKQDKYFDFLTKYFVKEDIRMLSYSDKTAL